MSNSSYRGKITKLERRQNDSYGNPRWRILLEDGASFNTADGFSVNFRINWTEYLNHWVELTLDSSRRVIDASTVAGPTPTVTNSALTDAYARALEDAAHDIAKYFDDAMEAYNNGLLDRVLPVDEWLLERAREVRGEQA